MPPAPFPYEHVFNTLLGAGGWQSEQEEHSTAGEKMFTKINYYVETY